MKHALTTRRLRVLLVATMIFFPELRLDAQDRNPWPLVNHAESTAWGSLTDVQSGREDLLWTLQVTESDDGRASRGPVEIRLLERAGRLPDGNALRLGVSGLFFYRSPEPGEGEFKDSDGWLLHGGFFPLEVNGATRSAVNTLITSSRAKPSAEALRAAAELLSHESEDCRSFVLAWLRGIESKLPDTLQDTLARGFSAEEELHVRMAYVRMFLARGLPLGDESVSGMVAQELSEEAHDLAVNYLQEHGKPIHSANLLLRFGRASKKQRILLMDAYARIGIEESMPFWWEALLGDDPELVDAALEGLATARLEASREIFEDLIESENPWIRGRALQGLVKMRAPGIRKKLRKYVKEAKEGDPALPLARRLLERPHRYSRTRKPVARRPDSGRR